MGDIKPKPLTSKVYLPTPSPLEFAKSTIPELSEIWYLVMPKW